MNLLIDGSSLLWRTYHVTKSQELVDIESIIHTFIKILKSYAVMYNSQDIYIAWDRKLHREKNFRQVLTSGTYKGQRDRTEAAKVYTSQSKIHKVTQTLGCKNMYPWVMEADDIIAWLSKNLTGNNIIITTDQDMLQLITPKTSVYQPRKKIIVDHSNFQDIMKMPIEHFLPYKAILGDKSDNIPGIFGCGPVGSRKLAKIWVEKTEPIKEEDRIIIEQNIKIMNLAIGYVIGSKKEVITYKIQLDRYSDLTIDMDGFKQLCEHYNFDSILNNLNVWEKGFKKSQLLQILENLPF